MYLANKAVIYPYYNSSKLIKHDNDMPDKVI